MRLLGYQHSLGSSSLLLTFLLAPLCSLMEDSNASSFLTMGNYGVARHWTAFSSRREESYLSSTLELAARPSTNTKQDKQIEDNNDNEPEDTVRVRVWRTLVAQNGREISLAKLSAILGERRSDVRHHLQHVEKQCKTLQSKSETWRLRRGLPATDKKRLQITTRRSGKKRNELFIKLE